MKSVTVEQIRKLDQLAINQYGVPSLILMENAGRVVAQQVLNFLRCQENSHVAIFCGLGNNAGDGFVAARHLINFGVKVETFLIGSAKSLKNDAEVNYQILKNCGYKIKEIHRVDPSFKRVLRKADCLVDAIFGVGLNREILNPFRSVIEAMNVSRKKIIAVDVPSGLDATTGQIYGTCVKASQTVTFTFPKKGFFRKQGPEHVGKVVVVDIGIPKKIYAC
ncbi:MAG: NAD(P)H-hydrate epimerase [Candidatus Omnitrophica bacterium]|nr:NAD(P)H-hydrate epimerase [Candidatus Omnitrophota bacterium]